MSDEADKDGDAEYVPYHMAIDEARDALEKLSKEADGCSGAVVSKDRLDAIGDVFRRLVSENEIIRRKAEDCMKRLGSLRGYMARYVEAVEREAYCKRDALEAFKEREVALAEMKRVVMEA